MSLLRQHSFAAHEIALQQNGNIVDMPVHEAIVISEHTIPQRKEGRMLDVKDGDIDDFIFGDDQPYVSEK